MDRLLQNYEINEVAKKTHISPLALERLFNYEFDKLDYVKIKGFIKILETEYPEMDFSELKEKFEEYSKKDEEDVIEIQEPKDSKKVYFIVILILALIVTIYIIQNNKKTSQNVAETNKTSQQIIPAQTKNDEINDSSVKMVVSKEDIKEENIEEQNNTPIEKVENLTADINNTVLIEPIERVWFKVTYLDDGNSKEYLTSHQVELNGSKRIFIKFGHGMIKINYRGKVIEPNTKKIIRVIIEDGEINITKKRVKEFE